MTRILLLLIGLSLGSALPSNAAGPVTVFAAASLRGVLDDIAAQYDAPVVLSFGGSGAIARQIAAGAPADVVILANRDWMAWLQSRRAVAQGQITTVAQNRLVVIGPADAASITAQELPARLGDSRLAMGQRDAVPAGTYAREWLTAAGLWDALKNQLAETDNVRAALALVARGETAFGVVYATDAAAEPEVSVVYEIPQGLHSPIRYPAAALTPDGQRFLDHLAREGAAAVFASYGYAQVTP